MKATDTRILVVDDNVSMRKVIRRALERAGYTVEEAEDGSAAREALARVAIQLVLLDLRMPGEDGLVTLNRIQNDPRFRLIPVILLTGAEETEDCVECFDTGAADFIRKPCHGIELVARIKAALRRVGAKDTWQRESCADKEEHNALIVEDEPEDTAVIRHMLETEGVFTRTTATAREFRAAIADEKAVPDLVLVDLILPDADGIDLVRELRRLPDFADTAVVVVSSIFSSRERAEVLEAGAEDFISKPYAVEELAARLRARIRESARRKGLRGRVKRLEADSNLDPKTGIAHAAALIAEIGREMARSLRLDRPLSLLFFDIDHFKRLNDTHGHLNGDKVLVKFARMLQDGVRVSDLPARFGGEEFAVLLPETTPEYAVNIAEHFRKITATTFPHGMTVSVGVASLRSGDLVPQDLISRADDALYRAKALGRDRVEVADSRKGHLAVAS